MAALLLPNASIATDVKTRLRITKDSEVVVDQGIITSRSPEDLGAFIRQDRRGSGEKVNTTGKAA